MFTFAAGLIACGTDSSSGNHGASDGGSVQTQGVTITTSDGSKSDGANFSLRVTDAPIDGLSKVVVQFTAVEMKLESNAWIKYTLPDPQPIDLLSLHGVNTADLLVNLPIKPGYYKQIRFLVDPTAMANYVELIGGGMVALDVPNGATNGIKHQQKFSIPSNRLANLTVDFDLRKSVKFKKKTGTYELKPKLRLVVDAAVGMIRGTVNPALLLAPSCSDLDVDTHNAVYVYSGHDVAPGDIDDDSNAEPVATAAIKYDPTAAQYVFEAAFLPAGNYTIAFTCNANAESVDDDDDDDDNDPNDLANLDFFSVQNVTILVTDTTFLHP